MRSNELKRYRCSWNYKILRNNGTLCAFCCFICFTFKLGWNLIVGCLQAIMLFECRSMDVYCRLYRLDLELRQPQNCSNCSSECIVRFSFFANRWMHSQPKTNAIIRLAYEYRCKRTETENFNSNVKVHALDLMWWWNVKTFLTIKLKQAVRIRFVQQQQKEFHFEFVCTKNVFVFYDRTEEIRREEKIYKLEYIIAMNTR